MNFPIWELDTIGGPSLIAFISVLHVYISQLAVGGGIFLWITDRYAEKKGDVVLRDFVRSHTHFFLLLTMVFGGVSGVGIWFIIALVHPAATTVLIHNFVFGWAIEWVFFVVEIVALLIYHYRFDQLDGKTRGQVALTYAIAAWLSLFIINGILSFMLTPGSWIKSHAFWEGFFNPTFFSSLVYRTFVTLLLAGLFAFLTAVRHADKEERHKLMKWAARWMLLPVVGLALSALWYYKTIPSAVAAEAFSRNPEMKPFMSLFGFASIAVFILGVVLAFRLPQPVQKALSIVLLITGLGWIGGFEYIREIARKPYVIYDYMYSNSVRVDQVASLNKDGVIKHAKWVDPDRVKSDNIGKDLFNIQCLSCHTRNGIYNSINDKVGSLRAKGIAALMAGFGKTHQYMPPFFGTDHERYALADYIAYDVLKRPRPKVVKEEVFKDPKIEKADPDASHLILAWNRDPIHFYADAKGMNILSNKIIVESQVIHRDGPEIVKKDITLHIKDYPEVKFSFNKKRKSFVSSEFVLKKKGSYQALEISVHDKTKKPLAKTTFVAQSSPEMRCANCHGGGYRADYGVTKTTAEAILELHDRDNKTHLLNDLRGGKDIVCSECHADSKMGAKGKSDHLDLSASIHGFHAAFLVDKSPTACAQCHPSGNDSHSKQMQGLHRNRLGKVANDCTRCHGDLNEHAISLLKTTKLKHATKLIRRIDSTTRHIKSIDDIKARTPWKNLPHCKSCHVDFKKPALNATAFNKWTEKESDKFSQQLGDSEAVRCAACHGSPHSLYPNNPVMNLPFNAQPLQWTDNPYPIGSNNSCQTCHKEEMSDSVHHDHMEHNFRGK